MLSEKLNWKALQSAMPQMLQARGETQIDGWRVPIKRSDKSLNVMVVHRNTHETMQSFSVKELRLAGLLLGKKEKALGEKVVGEKAVGAVGAAAEKAMEKAAETVPIMTPAEAVSKPPRGTWIRVLSNPEK